MDERRSLRGTIHVVDDDRAFRVAIGRVLGAAGHEVCLYESAAQYLEAKDSTGPACVIVDLRMPGIDGLDLQAALLQRKEAHPIVFLSGHGDIPSTVRAMRNGAVDFLTKPVPTPRLLDTIRSALEADMERRARRAHLDDLKARYATLTPREREVMAGVIAGLLNKQIGFALNAGERTIKTHRSRLLEKMGVRSVAELVRHSEDLLEGGVALEPTPMGMARR